MHDSHSCSGLPDGYGASPWQSGPVLLLAPHPDDEIVGCATAIRRAQAAGIRIHVAFLTTGLPDRDRLWTWQRSRHRQRVLRRLSEKSKAVAGLGLHEVAQQDWSSRSLKDRLGPLYELISGLITAHQIRCLWTPAYEGGHQDHDAVNFIASRFQSRCTLWEFAEYNWKGRKIGVNRFPEPNGSESILRLSPAEQAEKRRLLALYASERGNLNYVGLQQECFRPLPHYDYSGSPHSGPLFYQRFQWVPFRHPRIDFSRPDELCDRIAKFRTMESGG